MSTSQAVAQPPLLCGTTRVTTLQVATATILKKTMHCRRHDNAWLLGPSDITTSFEPVSASNNNEQLHTVSTHDAILL